MGDGPFADGKEPYEDDALVVARAAGFGLYPLERLGALAIRFLHQLTNDMTCLTSGLNLMEETLKESGTETEEILEQMAFLDQAYQRMNGTVTEFSSVRRSLRFDGLHPSVSGAEVSARLRPVLEACGFGSLEAGPELGRVQMDVRWLEECLLLARQLLGEQSTVSGGKLDLVSYEQVKPFTGGRFGMAAPKQCLVLELELGAGAPVLQAELKSNRLLASVLLNELLRQMRGVLVFAPDGSGQAAFYFPSVTA